MRSVEFRRKSAVLTTIAALGVAAAGALLIGEKNLDDYLLGLDGETMAKPGEMTDRLKRTDQPALIKFGNRVIKFTKDYNIEKRKDIIIEMPMGRGYVDVGIQTARGGENYFVDAEIKRVNGHFVAATTRLVTTDETIKLGKDSYETTDTVQRTGGWSAQTADYDVTYTNGKKHVTSFGIDEPNDTQMDNLMSGFPQNSFSEEQVTEAVEGARTALSDETGTINTALAGKR